MSDLHVDAVVVGSGFGGSVAAYRLAAAGRSVVVLERGRPYPPGSFARTPSEMSRAFWDPSEGLHGLFDVWRFRGFDSVVSSGLGGGSLIYANVLLRKDERWFVREDPLPGGGYEHWPVTRADLDPHYDAVEKMMGATPYPVTEPAYRDTPKTRAMREAAARNGLDWQLPPLTVSFAPQPGAEPGLGLPITDAAYGNVHGVPRRTCRLTGECDIGCNDGAKNTLDHTYLSAAQHHGADIRTRCEVRRIRPLDGGGYEVAYVRHDPAAAGRRLDTSRLPLHVVTCDRLVLGAGTYGTTYLLLRNRAALPGLGAALGTRYSGNGDLLAFLLPAGRGDERRTLDASFGPVITSAIRLGDAADGPPHAGRGFYVQDGGYPSFTNWLIEAGDVGGNLARFGQFLVRLMLGRLRRTPEGRVSGQIARLVGEGKLSAGSLPLLGMGRDVPDGVMRLRGDLLDVAWNGDASAEYFARVRETMKKLADTLDARFVGDWSLFLKRIITVHPVGGAAIGRHPGEGVCDPYGQVFGHPGLYVADGAAMPGPVGPNPSLTIAAHADRMATAILEERTAPARAPVRRAAATSLSFTEEMKGFVGLGETDPLAGERAGRDGGRRLMFHLTITAEDVETFLASTEHAARAEGWVHCDALGGRLAVTRGTFNLFTASADAGTRHMRYHLHFADADGNPLTLVGRKDIHDDRGADAWRDTTTLYYRVLAGHVDEDAPAPALGAGLLRIEPTDLARQVTTFRTHGPDGPEMLARFARFFFGQLWDVYAA